MNLKFYFSQFKFWIIATIVLILIDQLTKFAAEQLSWSVFLNDQFAFSLPIPIPVIFVIYFFVLLGMTWYVYKTWIRFTVQQKIAWAFVFAGGLSNVLERIFLGHVRDFIHISNGVWNVADFFIMFGLVLMLASARGQQSKIFPIEESSEKL